MQLAYFSTFEKPIKNEIKDIKIGNLEEKLNELLFVENEKLKNIYIVDKNKFSLNSIYYNIPIEKKMEEKEICETIYNELTDLIEEKKKIKDYIEKYDNINTLNNIKLLNDFIKNENTYNSGNNVYIHIVMNGFYKNAIFNSGNYSYIYNEKCTHLTINNFSSRTFIENENDYCVINDSFYCSKIFNEGQRCIINCHSDNSTIINQGNNCIINIYGNDVKIINYAKNCIINKYKKNSFIFNMHKNKIKSHKNIF